MAHPSCSENKSDKLNFSRRGFCQMLLATGALVIWQGSPAQNLALAEGTLTNNPLAFGPHLIINPDNSLIIGSPAPEIGSGMHTVLPMIVAEELGADWSNIMVRQLPVDIVQIDGGRLYGVAGRYGGGGSHTTRFNWTIIRQISAYARRLLIEAASEHMGLPADQLETKNSHVVHTSSDRRASFADLRDILAAIDFPTVVPNEEVHLKDPKDFTLLGTPQKARGVENIVTGKPAFGLDAEMDGMLYAVIERSPTFDGELVKLDSSKTLAIPGVREIVILKRPDINALRTYASAGVAVIADSLWAAMKGREALDITWDKGPGASENTADNEETMRRLVQNPGTVRVEDGQGKAALEDANSVLDVTYELPNLAHACMEPMNWIAHWKGDSIDMKGPGQNCGSIHLTISRTFGIHIEKINFMPTRAGGSFGRRLVADYAIEAVEISKRIKAPIQVVWTREDDISHDGYRPMSAHHLRGGLTEDGKIKGWYHTVAMTTQASMRYRGEVRDTYTETVWENNFPRRLVEDFELDTHELTWSAPWGAWRGPVPTQQAFVTESFMDELAEKAGKDPLEFRLALLEPGQVLPYEHWGGPTYDTGRWAACLRKVAEKANWGKPMPNGSAQGLAGYFTFGSYGAMVLEIIISPQNTIHVTKVTAALDCGRVLNPNGARAQVEGGIMDGLSVALHQKIDIEGGGTVQKNFDTYRLLRIDEAPPEINVHIIEGSEDIFGTGEIGVPPVAPALCNAIYRATGKRIRKLPIGDQLKG